MSWNFNFSIFCFLETWAIDININKNSSFQLPNYNIEHQKIRQEEEGYASLFMNHLIKRKEKILMYQYNMIPTISKPTMGGKISATSIDHIIANCIVHCQFKIAIFKQKQQTIFFLLWLWEQINLFIKAKTYKMYASVTTTKKPSNHLNNGYEKLTG